MTPGDPVPQSFSGISSGYRKSGAVPCVLGQLQEHVPIPKGLVLGNAQESGRYLGDDVYQETMVELEPVLLAVAFVT